MKSTILLTIALFMISAPNPDPTTDANGLTPSFASTISLAPISSAVADEPAPAPEPVALVHQPVEPQTPDAPRTFGEEWEFVQPEPVQPAALSVARADDRLARPTREQPWSRAQASLN